MRNSQKPSMPCTSHRESSSSGRPIKENNLGLTKLEHFAGLAMQGLLASTDLQTSRATEREAARMAVSTAFALLVELEEQK